MRSEGVPGCLACHFGADLPLNCAYRTPILLPKQPKDPDSETFPRKSGAATAITSSGKESESMETTLKDWLGSFWHVMIYPSQGTFAHESQKAGGKTTSAIGWLIFLAVFLHLYNYVVFKSVSPLSVVLLTLLLIPLDFFLLAFWLDTISRKVFHHKTSSYEQFLYIGVVIGVVSQILFSILNLIPPLRGYYLAEASYLYPIIILIVAVHSLTKLRIWESIITVILSVLLSLIIFACTSIFLLSMASGVIS